MRPEDRDAAYLWDILHVARDAAAITSGLTEEQLRRDRVRILALERSMELIGEAARRLVGTEVDRRADSGRAELERLVD